MVGGMTRLVWTPPLGTLLLALASLTLAGCSSPGDRHEYEYLLMHYEADPDNENDPEHVLKAFNRCLASKPVTEEWEAEKAKQGPEASAATSTVAGGAKEGERIAAQAMQRGSKLQALADQCMAAKGYRTVP
jgi:hypothetical protein